MTRLLIRTFIIASRAFVTYFIFFLNHCIKLDLAQGSRVLLLDAFALVRQALIWDEITKVAHFLLLGKQRRDCVVVLL